MSKWWYHLRSSLGRAPWEPPRSHPTVSFRPHLMTVACWLKVCQRLSYWSELAVRCLADRCCLAVSSCLCICCACLVFGYLCATFYGVLWGNRMQPGSSEESTCRRRSFVLCYRSSFSCASSFKLGSPYRTLRSSAQASFLLCVGNALGMRSRACFRYS